MQEADSVDGQQRLQNRDGKWLVLVALVFAVSSSAAAVVAAAASVESRMGSSRWALSFGVLECGV